MEQAIDAIDDKDEGERELLSRLIREHDGKISAMAQALGVQHRQGLARRLERCGLAEEAARARRAAGVRGPRPQADTRADDAKERARVLGALVQHGGTHAAARALGISPRTMARRIKDLGITPAARRKAAARAK